MLQRTLRIGSASTSALVARPALCARPLARRPLAPIAARQCLPSRSLATAIPGQDGEKKGFRVSYLFGGLVGLGMLVTIYGLLEYYYSLQTWPEPVRTPLKAALKARNSGDYDRSEAYFRKAIEAAMSIPATSLEPDPLLKLSGLYITMSSMFESTYQPIKAFSSLREALPHFGEEPLAKDPKYRISSTWAGAAPLTDEEHKRVIGISQKLGQMALQLSSTRVPPPFPVLEGQRGPSGWEQAAEEYLSSALTSMLRLGMKPGKPGSVAVAGRDVDLPRGGEGDMEDGGGRVDKRGLGMTMEALAEVYARRGQYDLAGNLLLQAVSTLLPPGSKEPPPMRDRCQAAMLMTTISSHALQPRTEQAQKASRSWSLRSLQIAQQALKENGDQVTDAASATCARAKTVGLQNLGMLAEMEGDASGAMKHFTQALESAKDTNFAEAKREANEAIRRLKASSTSA